MRRIWFFVAPLAVVCCASVARGARLDGFVFLMPVDSTYRSVGRAEYLNDLNARDTTAVLSGEHSVNSPGVLNVYAVYAKFGLYSYELQGQAQPGTCYGTTLHVVGDPPGLFNTREETWTGAERCAPGTRPGPIQISQLCPLILDLNGDGIHTTGLESPVRFWSFSGVKTDSGWTDPATEEAFLWLDSETDHAVEEAELFGSRMPSPTGGVHRNGFQALEKYDRQEFGGNSDGRISTADRIWGRLRLWIDRDHDGVADPTEISPPAAHRIVAMNLDRVHDQSPYSNGNSLMLVGSYVRRTAANDFEQREMVDIGFVYPP